MISPKSQSFTDDERRFLLHLARRSIEAAVGRQSAPWPSLHGLGEHLQQHRACFVTLNKRGQLRGCTGILLARQPLANEVVYSAGQTALNDPRFTPVILSEIIELTIEISVLNSPVRLANAVPDHIPQMIRPGIDGVTLNRGPYRATFLPQVWNKINDPQEFLSRLCEKMGLPPSSWLEPGMSVDVYQVEEFAEDDFTQT